MVALRRLGLEEPALKAGSVIERTRTFLSTGEVFGSVDFAALGEIAGAASICLHRAAFEQILLDATRAGDPQSVQIGRECIGFAENTAEVCARFSDGSSERGDVLIGADGITPSSAANSSAWKDLASQGISHGAALLSE